MKGGFNSRYIELLSFSGSLRGLSCKGRYAETTTEYFTSSYCKLTQYLPYSGSRESVLLQYVHST